jgi:hypothetical protein
MLLAIGTLVPDHIDGVPEFRFAFGIEDFDDGVYFPSPANIVGAAAVAGGSFGLKQLRSS